MQISLPSNTGRGDLTLNPKSTPQTQTIAKGLKTDGGPVLLVEAADCCGGGAAGDSVATLTALLDAKVTVSSLVPVADPEAAAACHRACVGQEDNRCAGASTRPALGQTGDRDGHRHPAE